jgi:hypothetical protein
MTGKPTVTISLPQGITCDARNKDALLDFWYHGGTGTKPEMNDFIQRLQSV